MPTYEIRAGKVVVEPKDAIKARLGRSPNRADAVVYANYVRPRAIPAPPMPTNPEDKNLGVMRDERTGKPRVPDDLVKHPGRPQVEPDQARYWSNWGR